MTNTNDETVRFTNELTYNFLLREYLISQTTGNMGQFNKEFFPNDYNNMECKLEDLDKRGK